MVPVPTSASRRLEHATAGLRRLEHSLRCAYVHVPPSVLARVDGPLRALVGGVRRGGTVGFYVSQPPGAWSGLSAGRPATVVMWGRDLPALVHLLFDAEPTTNSCARLTNSFTSSRPV